MPDPEKMLRMLRRAIELTRATAGRQGRLTELQQVNEVMIAGDLHGHVGHFQTLFKRAELGQNPQRHFVMQEAIHGAFYYPDGSDRSHQLVDLYCALKCQHPQQVHYIMGNHELAQWLGRKIAKGDYDQCALFGAGVDFAYGEFAPQLLQGYQELFAVLPFALRTPNRVWLSHSLPHATKLANFSIEKLQAELNLPDQIEIGGPIYSMMWARDASPTNTANFLQCVDADYLISGHIPTDEGYATPNPQQLILDCAESPAAYCLFSTTEPITQELLVSGVQLL